MQLHEGSDVLVSGMQAFARFVRQIADTRCLDRVHIAQPDEPSHARTS